MKMNTKPLGRLQRVTLREIWADEAREFISGLASEVIMALLSETVGMELEMGQERLG